MKTRKTKDEQIEELRLKLAEAEANMDAIRSGEADAIVVQTDSGITVFTIQGAEAAYRIMVETMNEGALTVDPDGVILYVNARFSQMLGVPASSLVGKLIRSYIPEDKVDDFTLFLRKTMAGGKIHQDFELIRQDLSELPVYLSSAPLEILGRHDVCIVAMDLTERYVARRRLMELNSSLEKKVRERTSELEEQKAELEENREQLQKLTLSLEEQVEFRTGQVRELAKALSLAEQHQRQRLSIILHEDLQQVLFATKIRFGLLNDIIREGSREEMEEDIRELEDLVSRAITTTRRVAIEFNPPILKGEGLDASLKWLAYHIEKQYGLKVKVNMPSGFRVLQEDERVLVVQLVQELLLNVVKHAETGNASITIKEDSGHILIIIEDRGVGFDLEKEKQLAQDSAHMGLFSIKERLHLFGGNLRIETAPGKGTKIVMNLPFDTGKHRLTVE